MIGVTTVVLDTSVIVDVTVVEDMSGVGMIVVVFGATPVSKNETCSVKIGFKAFKKSIHSYQPARAARADMGRKGSLSLKFSAFHKKNPHESTV